MLIHAKLTKEQVNEVKYYIESKIKEGLTRETAIVYGVKYIEKLFDKIIKKHKRIALKHAEYKLIQDYIIDKIDMNDPMETYYGKKYNPNITNNINNSPYTSSDNQPN